MNIINSIRLLIRWPVQFGGGLQLIGRSTVICVFIYIVFLRCLGAEEGAIDYIVIKRDSPEYKLDLTLGAGWVLYRTMSIEKSGETAGWIVREFKPDGNAFAKMIRAPIDAKFEDIPAAGRSLPALYYIRLYLHSGVIKECFVTADAEERLKDGTVLKSDPKLAQWLSEDLTMINNESAR